MIPLYEATKLGAWITAVIFVFTVIALADAVTTLVETIALVGIIKASLKPSTETAGTFNNNKYYNNSSFFLFLTANNIVNYNLTL